jgi:hypothetical protein
MWPYKAPPFYLTKRLFKITVPYKCRAKWLINVYKRTIFGTVDPKDYEPKKKI